MALNSEKFFLVYAAKWIQRAAASKSEYAKKMFYKWAYEAKRDAARRRRIAKWTKWKVAS